VHLSLLVIDVFSEFFAVFPRKQSQQFLNSDDALQLNFVHLLAGYLSQRSEKLDFDLHLCSTLLDIIVFFVAEFILFYAPNYLLIVDDRGLSWVLVD
jgi:hypothetical protein